MARGATTVCLMACAIMVLATSVVGSDIAAVPSSGYSPRECPSGKAPGSKGRCVPIRDPAITAGGKVYQPDTETDSCELKEETLNQPGPNEPAAKKGLVVMKASVSKTAAAVTTAGAKYSRKIYAPATLPDGAVVAKVVFTADTTEPPKGANGVRCVVTNDPAVASTWVDETKGAYAFYGARTSRCYSCGGRKQPRFTEITEDTCAYSPVDCLARCSKSDEVGKYTVVVESRLRRNAEQTIGTAWMTLPSPEIDDLAGLCAYTFRGQYGRDWVIAPLSEPEPEP